MRREYKLAVLLGDRPNANPSPPPVHVSVPSSSPQASLGVVRTIAEGGVVALNLGDDPSPPAFSASPTRTRDGSFAAAESAARGHRSGGVVGGAVRMSVMDQSSLFGLAREAAEYVPELSGVTREAMEMEGTGTTTTTGTTQQADAEEDAKVHAAITAAALAALGGAAISPIDDEDGGGKLAQTDHDVVRLRPDVISSTVRILFVCVLRLHLHQFVRKLLRSSSNMEPTCLVEST